MTQYIDKDRIVAELERRRSRNSRNKLNLAAAFEDNYLLSFIDTLEVKEVDLKKKSYVKIDRKVLFEICDAILNHYGYSDTNDCPENDSECFWNKWDDDFRKKVENIRNNS